MSEPEKPAWSAPFNDVENMIAATAGVENKGRPADKWLNEVVRWTWRVKISLHLETEPMTGLREKSETEAIKVFARNLKDLLLAAPAGPRATLGLDPGLRTGVKVAVVDNTGKWRDTKGLSQHLKNLIRLSFPQLPPEVLNAALQAMKRAVKVAVRLASHWASREVSAGKLHHSHGDAV